MLTIDSYLMYIALIAFYLVLIIFFFPETRWVSIFDVCEWKTKLILMFRNMTIEAVSVLFDTGRKGDAEEASRKLNHDIMGKDEDAVVHVHVDDVRK